MSTNKTGNITEPAAVAIPFSTDSNQRNEPKPTPNIKNKLPKGNSIDAIDKSRK